MKIRHEITYDAPATDVWTMLSDPAFRQKSCEAMGVLSCTIAIDLVGHGMNVRIDQVQRTEVGLGGVAADAVLVPRAGLDLLGVSERPPRSPAHRTLAAPRRTG